jgi:hypothetical protein
MRNRLTTTEIPSETNSAERWEETTDLTSNSRKRRHHGETGQAGNGRQKAAFEGGDPQDLEADHRPDYIVSTASSSMRHPAQSMHDDSAADSFHDNRLISPLGTAVSNLLHQNTDNPSPTLHNISDTPHVENPDIPGAAQERQPEQYISKAEKLVTSHSRRYF